MKLKIKATTPCVKYINATPDEQLEKMLEEVLEVSDAWKLFENEKNEENLVPLLMELLDVKACVNTAIAQLQLAVEDYNDGENEYEQKGMYKNATAVVTYKCLDDYISFKRCYKEAKRNVIAKNMVRGYYVLDERE